MRYFFIILIFLNADVLAQPYQCNSLKTYRDGGYNANLYDISSTFCIDKDDNKYIVGFFEHELVIDTFHLTTNMKRGLYFAKYDKNDSLVLVKKIGEGSFLSFFNLFISNDDDKNNIYISFNIVKDDSILLNNQLYKGANLSDIIIIKFDKYGNNLKVFTETINLEIVNGGKSNIIIKNSYMYSFSTFRCDTSIPIQQCSVNFHGFNLNASNYEVLIVKYDSNFVPLWVKTAGGISSEYGLGLHIDENENLYIMGTTKSATLYFDSISLNIPFNSLGKVFFAKYDRNGNAKWARYIASPYQVGLITFAGQRIVASGNHVYICGYGSSNNSNQFYFQGGVSLVNPDGGWSSFICKYDSLGNYQWAKITRNGYYGLMNNIAIDKEKNVYATGYYDNYLAIDTDSIFSSGGNDTYLLKMDTLGVVKSFKTIGGQGLDFCKVIDLNSDEDVYMLGGTNSNPLVIDNETVNPNILTSNKFLAKLTKTPTSTQAYTIPDIKIYPNPAGETIHISNPQILVGTINIYNTMGQVLATQKIQDKEISISTENLPNGIYMVQLKTEKNIINQKIIVQH